MDRWLSQPCEVQINLTIWTKLDICARERVWLGNNEQFLFVMNLFSEELRAYIVHHTNGLFLHSFQVGVHWR